jgi:hypothetical protein
MSAVREELIKHRGSQFDPQIVDLVVKNDLLKSIETSTSQIGITASLAGTG